MEKIQDNQCQGFHDMGFPYVKLLQKHPKEHHRQNKMRMLFLMQDMPFQKFQISNIFLQHEMKIKMQHQIQLFVLHHRNLFLPQQDR